MLNVIRLSVIMLSVVMLSVAEPYFVCVAQGAKLTTATVGKKPILMRKAQYN